MKIYTADRETGTFIEECSSIVEALEFIADYEAIDQQDGTFEPEFYDIVDENHCSILAAIKGHKYIITYKAKRKNAKRHVHGWNGRTEYFDSYEAAKKLAANFNECFVVEIMTANYKPVDEFGRVIK